MLDHVAERGEVVSRAAERGEVLGDEGVGRDEGIRTLPVAFREAEVEVHGEFRDDHFPHFGIRKASAYFILDLLKPEIEPYILKIQIGSIHLRVPEEAVRDQFGYHSVDVDLFVFAQFFDQCSSFRGDVKFNFHIFLSGGT